MDKLDTWKPFCNVVKGEIKVRHPIAVCLSKFLLQPKCETLALEVYMIAIARITLTLLQSFKYS